MLGEDLRRTDRSVRLAITIWLHTFKPCGICGNVVDGSQIDRGATVIVQCVQIVQG